MAICLLKTQQHLRITAGIAVLWKIAVKLQGVPPKGSHPRRKMLSGRIWSRLFILTHQWFLSDPITASTQLLLLANKFPFSQISGKLEIRKLLSICRFYGDWHLKELHYSHLLDCPRLYSGIAMPCVEGGKTEIFQNVAACVKRENHKQCLNVEPSNLAGPMFIRGLSDVHVCSTYACVCL